MSAEVCWYCHWGWSSQVAEIYDRCRKVAGESAADYGPAHIVWANENFEREHIQWCLDNFEENARADPEWTQEELAAVRRSLEELLALPDQVLCPEPADYDGENPKAFPPPLGITMVHVSPL